HSCRAAAGRIELSAAAIAGFLARTTRKAHGKPMSRQDANAAFARTSFLYGGNAAYIEDLYSRHERDPASLNPEWRDFSQALKDDKTDVIKSAKGPNWQKPNWPVREGGDL